MTFVEREKPEPVDSFQVDFSDEDALSDVFAAFGIDKDGGTWKLQAHGGEWKLSFPRPMRSNNQASVKADPSGFYTISLVVGSTSDTASGDVVVNDGDWIVTRYVDTDYPEVLVMGDRDFQRQYRRESAYVLPPEL